MELGRRLGPYVLERKLGEGGMGAVYAARHERIGRLYAVKVLLPAIAARRDALARFEREARALSALGHPNIVPVHDFAIEADGTAYLAMDLLDGAELSRAIAEGPMAPARVRRIAMDVAAGLGAAHRIGLVHRDLKPSNVFLVGRGERERAVLLDFGLAKALGGEAAHDTLLRDKVTASGTILGTPHYMSPEQARGEAIDARSDVWALGVVTYEMRSGRLPFDGPTIATIFAAILATEPVSPETRLHAPRTELDALVMRCLDKDPAQRPRDGDEVLAILEGAGASGAPVTRAVPMHAAATVAATPISVDRDATPEARPAPTPISVDRDATPEARPAATPPTRATPSGEARTVAAPSRGSRAGIAAAVAGAALVLVAGTAWVTLSLVRPGTPSATPPTTVTALPPAPPREAAPVDSAPVEPAPMGPAETESAPPAPPPTALPPPASEAPIAHATPRHRASPAPSPEAPPSSAPPPSRSSAPSAPPSTDSLAGRVPPGMETSPGARELADAGDLMQNGDFEGCLRVLEHAPETQHILSVRMSCANAAHDRPALEAVCARFAQRYPESLFNQTCAALLGAPH